MTGGEGRPLDGRTEGRTTASEAAVRPRLSKKWKGNKGGGERDGFSFSLLLLLIASLSAVRIGAYTSSPNLSIHLSSVCPSVHAAVRAGEDGFMMRHILHLEDEEGDGGGGG